jgi:hypothetical protein
MRTTLYRKLDRFWPKPVKERNFGGGKADMFTGANIPIVALSVRLEA